MNFKVTRLDRGTWINVFSEYAHMTCFGELKAKELDRIDYALLAISDDERPIGYMTCREFDAETIYWQYGGSFPPIKDTIWTFKVYCSFMEWHKDKYKRVVTYIENTNKVMLKMAAKIGFLVTGVRNYKGDVLLEHLLEFNGGNNA